MDLPKTYEVYLERSPAMKILGEMVTFRFPAFIINAVLLAATVSLLIESGFSLLSILISVFIFIPIFIFMQLRFINKGSYLMKKHAILTIYQDKITLIIGYPLSFNYKLNSVPKDDVLKLVLRGDPTFGFYLEFEQETINKQVDKIKDLPTKERLKKRALIPTPARFGLWKDPEEAKKLGEEIAEYFDFNLTYNYSPDGEKLIVS